MRFFVNAVLSTDNSLTLPDTVYHHWVKVLRAKIGDKAVLFNGQGGEFTATLTQINKKTAEVMIGEFCSNNRTPHQKITLAQAISKGERMDYTIQKACEMGVSCVYPIISERSERLRYERDTKKLTHWQNVAISACEQCGLNIIPKIRSPVTFDEFIQHCQDDLKLIMTLPSNHTAFHPKLPLPQKISIVVGPEGGFCTDELNLAQQNGFLAWAIGERVLRTETAGIVAMAGLFVLAQQSNLSAQL